MPTKKFSCGTVKGSIFGRKPPPKLFVFGLLFRILDRQFLGRYMHSSFMSGFADASYPYCF